MRRGGAGDRLPADVGQQRLDARRRGLVVDQVERQRQVRFAVGAQPLARLVQRAGPVRLHLPGLGQRVEGERLLVELPGFEALRRLEAFGQVAHAAIQHGLIHGEAGLLGLRQRKDDVRRDRDPAVVALPPAPAAVHVLLRVDPLQPHADLLRELGVQIGPRHPQLLQRRVGDDVGQEAAHGLLGALVRVVLQVGQPAQHPRGQARFQRHVQLALRRVGVRRDAHQFEALLVRPHLAAGADHFRRGVAVDRQGDLDRVLQGRDCRDRLRRHQHLDLARAGRHRHGPDRLVRAARRDRDRAGGLRGQVKAGRLDIDRHLPRIGGRVVDHGGDLGPVAVDEEARQHRPHQQVLGGDDVGLALPHPRVGGGRAGVHRPGGQVVGQRHLDLRLPVGAGRHVRPPERAVGELAADAGHLGAAAATAAALAPFCQLGDEPIHVQHPASRRSARPGPR